MSKFIEDPAIDRVTINFKGATKPKFIQAMKDNHCSSPSELVILLLHNYLMDDIDSLTRYRRALQSRIKKGINYRYLQELKKLNELLNLYLKNL